MIRLPRRLSTGPDEITCSPAHLRPFSRSPERRRHICNTMDNSVPLIFRVFKFIIPTFAVIIFCTALCKCLQRKRQRQRQLAAASAHAQGPQPSVYIIPFSPSGAQPTVPPQYRYDTPQQHAPPPPYNELMAKDDFPHEPPPAYTESDSSQFISSNSGRISPSCSTCPE